MPQIISSAIGNFPPPRRLLYILQTASRAQMVDSDTKMKMVKCFHGKLFLAQRNWCEVQQLEHIGSINQDERRALVFQLRCEHPGTKGQINDAKDPMTFDVTVQRYDPSPEG